MKKLIVVVIVSMFTIVSCTRASKSCKANQKKIIKMRKSGQLNKTLLTEEGDNG